MLSSVLKNGRIVDFWVSWRMPFMVSIAVTLIVTAIGTTDGHSGATNLSWFMQYREVLLSEWTLPRHLPKMWHGLGGLDFFFYGHLPYFFSSLLTLPCFNCGPQWPFAAGMGFSFGLSVLTFFAFARRFTDANAALAGATLYALMAYHLAIDQMWRQAAGEVYAYAFMPLIARGIDVVLRDKRLSLGLPISVALLLATHLPSAVLAVHVFALTFMVWAIGSRDASLVGISFLRLLWLALVGGAIAALLWLPALYLLKDVSPEALYSSHFVATRWLFSPWGFVFSDVRTMNFILMAFILSAILVVVGYQYSSGAGQVSNSKLWLLVPFLVSTFLMSVFSYPFWEFGLLPKVQFPWRLMVFVEFSAALGAALAFSGARHSQVASAALIFVVGGTLAFTMHVSIRQSWVDYDKFLPSLKGATEYLPRPFTEALLQQHPSDTENIAFSISKYLQSHGAEFAKKTDVKILSKHSREIRVQAQPNQTVVHLAVPSWKYWVARDETGVLAVRPDEMGLMEIAAEPERTLKGTITVTLPVLPVEKLAAALSIIGIGGLFGTAWFCRRKRSCR